MRHYVAALILMSLLAFAAGLITGMNLERKYHPFAPQAQVPAAIEKVPELAKKPKGVWI